MLKSSKTAYRVLTLKKSNPPCINTSQDPSKPTFNTNKNNGALNFEWWQFYSWTLESIFLIVPKQMVSTRFKKLSKIFRNVCTCMKAHWINFSWMTRVLRWLWYSVSHQSHIKMMLYVLYYVHTLLKSNLVKIICYFLACD